MFSNLDIIVSKLESTKDTTESTVGACKKTVEESAGRESKDIFYCLCEKNNIIDFSRLNYCNTFDWT